MKSTLLPALSALILLTSPAYSGFQAASTRDFATPGGVQVAPGSAIGDDDALVLRVVIEHTLVPAVERSNSGRNRATVVLVEDRSIPMCTKPRVSDAPCRIPDQWQQFLRPNVERGWPAMVDNDRRRSELVDSLETRNALSHPLPAVNHPAVVLIAAGPSPEARERYREQTGGYSRLSLPGYSTDGHALVFGSYYCGNVCGYGWLFVLKKSDGTWQMQSAVVTVIS